MSKKTVPDLKELFKQASEIAAQVPENMQEAAFNRAIDLLTVDNATDPLDRSRAKRRATTTQKKTQGGNGAKPDSTIDTLLTMIDSTQHPGVTSGRKVLDRSLMVLQIALSEHKIDGLTPSEISKILTDKFRVNTTSAAVGMALGKETSLVNRVPQGQGFSYRIMGPGQDYLAHLGDSDENTHTPPRKQKTLTKRKKSEAKSESPAAAASKTTPKPSVKKISAAKKTPGKIGPKAAIVELISSDFFSKAKTGPEVQAYLKKKRCFDLGIDQLRLAMLRLVRDHELDRDENEDGQYEYIKPKS